MARKKDSGGGGGYNWMDTYGDLVTLLLCFFVLLFAMSSIDAAKFQELAASFSGAIMPIARPIDPGPANLKDVVQPPDEAAGNPGFTPKPTPIVEATDQPSFTPSRTPSPEDLQREAVDVQFNRLYSELLQYVATHDMESYVGVGKNGNQITLTFTDSVFFDLGKAELKPESVEVIEGMIPFFEAYQDIIETIRVEGHTDNLPIHTSTFKNNRWLSYFRAGNVLEYIQANSVIAPEKLAADGRGEYQPVDTNETPEGRARNRRVEFVIIETLDATVRANPATFQGVTTPGPSPRPMSIGNVPTPETTAPPTAATTPKGE